MNKHSKKEINYTIYDLQLRHACALITPHTLHTLPSTSAIHQPQTFPNDTYLCRDTCM